MSNMIDTPANIRTKPEVLEMIDAIDRSLSELQEVSHILAERLGSVTRDKKEKEEVNKQPEMKMSCDISRMLADKNYTINQIREFLQDLINYLEI